ncbi:MAG: helix-turn-helix transcriptional regulator [Hyphomicrobiales bacterium]
MEGGLNQAASSPLAAAIIALGSPEFPERLLDFLQCIADTDASMILRYWPDRAPEVLADRLDPKERPYLYGDYLAGVYRLSPFYRLSAGLKEPRLVRLKEIAPEGFRQSEYFRSYFARIGVSDLAGMLLPVSSGGVVHVSFARSERRPSFGRRVLGELRTLLPVFAALALRHWRDAGEGKAQARVASPLEVMRAEFDLTRRETEIAEAMLAGHSSKSMARLLSISAETVKVHRRNLYAKLGIASQAELFSLFLGRMGR